MSAGYIQVHLRLNFFMETKVMNPDQTAPKEQSDLGPYRLQYSLKQTRGADDKTCDWQEQGYESQLYLPTWKMF